MKIFNSTENFYRGKGCDRLDTFNGKNEIESLEVIKNEEFGFFAAMEIEEESCINVMDDFNLPWWGLSNRYRVVVESPLESVRPYLIGYVRDDDGIEKADIIYDEKSENYPQGVVPLFISGKVPEDFKETMITLEIKIWEAKGYEKEQLIDVKKIDVKIIDFALKMDIEDSFYLDLWQHPCSWARIYGVDYFSEDHFEIIENYLKEMKKIGQKVIDLVVSDFPWAGQKCFDIGKNASRLYEYNIVGVSRENKKLKMDFANLDRYVNLCLGLGIDQEINLFGLLGNWHGFDFGSPLKDYRDPVRIKVYDEEEKCFDYIRTREELQEYLGALFEHLKEKEYLKITKIVGDEPGDAKRFEEFTSFLQSTIKEPLAFKYALHSTNFFEKYEGDLESTSVNTLLIGEACKGGEIQGKLAENSEKLTWYSCCFPDRFNIFIKSPLIESRYHGLYTYLWKMKGMLRWAYGIYVENVFEDLTYKPEKWAAGDMLLVYPGKDKKVVHSLREKNLLYGIQDFNLLKMIEKEDRSIYQKLRTNLGIELLIEEKDGDILLDKYADVQTYFRVRNILIKKHIEG